MFNLYDKDGNRFECECLFTFDRDGKNFIVYNDRDNNILASFYEMDGDKMVISPISDDRDFDIVDKALEEWRGNRE